MGSLEIFDLMPKDAVRVVQSYCSGRMNREDVKEMLDDLEAVYQRDGRTLTVSLPDNAECKKSSQHWKVGDGMQLPDGRKAIVGAIELHQVSSFGVFEVRFFGTDGEYLGCHGPLVNMKKGAK